MEKTTDDLEKAIGILNDLIRRWDWNGYVTAHMEPHKIKGIDRYIASMKPSEIEKKNNK
jgi:hypothetical protein